MSKQVALAAQARQGNGKGEAGSRRETQPLLQDYFSTAFVDADGSRHE